MTYSGHRHSTLSLKSNINWDTTPCLGSIRVRSLFRTSRVRPTGRAPGEWRVRTTISTPNLCRVGRGSAVSGTGGKSVCRKGRARGYPRNSDPPPNLLFPLSTKRVKDGRGKSRVDGDVYGSLGKGSACGARVDGESRGGLDGPLRPLLLSTASGTPDPSSPQSKDRRPQVSDSGTFNGK